MSHQMKVVWKLQGNHVKATVFTAPDKDKTYANCGELTFSKDEWSDVSVTLACGGVEVEAR